MENNCFVLKLKDSVLGDYDKLNFLKIKVTDGETLGFSPDKIADMLIIAKDCTFTLKHYLIIDATEYTFKNIPAYQYLGFLIKGNGYLYVSNKYDLGLYLLYNVDLDKIYSYDKAITAFKVPYRENKLNYIKGNINHLFSLCSPNLKTFVLSGSSLSTFDITGDFTEITKFTNLTSLALNNLIFSGNVSIFSPLVNLNELIMFDSNMEGNIEELALAWYNNGKNTGTVMFLCTNTNIIIPSTITSKGIFYCTFTESGYTFSQTNPNT